MSNQVDVDPEELRMFVARLINSADTFDAEASRMRKDYKAQEVHWNDQRYREFSHIIDHNAKILGDFSTSCREFAVVLRRRAALIEEAMQVSFRNPPYRP